MAYRADIEIGVRGARNLEQLRSAINQTARAVDSLNEVVGQRGRLVQSIQNYTNNLDRAAQSLKRVGAGTEAETKAVREYVQILGQATTARERQNNLIEDQIRLQQTAARTARLAAGGIRENPNQYAGPIGPGAASAVTLSSKLYGRLEQLINQQKAEAQAASEATAQIKEQARALDALRNSEAAASTAARQRLAVVEAQRRAAGPGVMTRPIAGAAYATPAGPGGSGITRASAVAASAAIERQVAQTRRTEAQAELKIVKDRGIAESYISGVINRRLEAKAKELALEKQQTAEVQKRAASERRKRTENVIIGGAFPMLFGAGPGAVLGGAAGGLIPGNPMLSVATSALGAVLDQFAAQATELGKSLQDPIKNFDALKEANLFASSSQERYIQKLIESGRVAEAQAAIQAELFKKVSTQGVADLQNLGAASTKLSRAWAEFNLQLQTAIAGPMAGLLSWLAGIVNISNEVSRKNAATESFLTALSKNPKQYQAYLRESSAMAAANGGRVNEAAVQALRERYMPGGVPTGTNLSAASQETIQLEKAKTSELRAQVDLAAKQLSLAGFDININREGYAVRAKDVALQEYKNKLLEIQNLAVREGYNAERNTLMIREANLNYAAKLSNIDAQVRESAARAAKEAADINKRNYLQQLDLILQINDASTEYNKIQADMQTYVQGEAEGLRVQAGFIDAALKNKREALGVQRIKALMDTTDANNAANINILYKQQVINATQLAALEKSKFLALAAQLDLQEKLTRLSEERTKGQQLSGLETQAQKTLIGIANPFGGAKAEKATLLLDQQVRRTEILGTQADKITDLTEKLNVAKANYQEGDIKRYTEQIALEQAHQTQLTEHLAILDQLEQRQLKQNQLMQQYGNIVVNELSTAMSSAVTAVITGTGTVQEAFATMFQNIGKAFIDMATQMIAQALVMKVLGILGGGAASPGASAARGTPGAVAPNGAAYFGPAFAEGGFVTGPTRALIGEGGQPEYVIPASKMRAAMKRYATGSRGSAVIPAGNDAGDSGASISGGVATVDVRYTVERINSVDYVTADQFQRGMQQAAEQGAQRGQQATLRRLQNSSSTRRQLGL